MRCSPLSGCFCVNAAFSTSVPPIRPLRWTKIMSTQNFISALQKCSAEYGLELYLNSLQLHVTLLEHFTLKGFTSQYFSCEVLIQSADAKWHTFLTICHDFYTRLLLNKHSHYYWLIITYFLLHIILLYNITANASIVASEIYSLIFFLPIPPDSHPTEFLFKPHIFN